MIRVPPSLDKTSGCQKEIVKLITEQDADYVITLKKNQGSLYKNVDQLFKEAIRTGFQGIEHSAYHTREQTHGRSEIRHYLMLTDVQERVDPTHKWSKLKSIGLVESVRTVDGKTTVETRYYISSLPANAKLFGQSVRGHWGIENSLHWSLRFAPAFQKAGARRSDSMSHLMKMIVELGKITPPKILLSCSEARLIY